MSISIFATLMDLCVQIKKFSFKNKNFEFSQHWRRWSASVQQTVSPVSTQSIPSFEPQFEDRAENTCSLTSRISQLNACLANTPFLLFFVLSFKRQPLFIDPPLQKLIYAFRSSIERKWKSKHYRLTSFTGKFVIEQNTHWIGQTYRAWHFYTAFALTAVAVRNKNLNSTFSKTSFFFTTWKNC